MFRVVNLIFVMNKNKILLSTYDTTEVNAMPNIKSAIKRVKTNEKRRLLNATQKSALRTAMKVADTALMNQEVETAKAAVTFASKKLDKAVTKGLIHKNAAARKKSCLAIKLNNLLTQS